MEPDQLNVLPTISDITGLTDALVYLSDKLFSNQQQLIKKKQHCLNSDSY